MNDKSRSVLTTILNATFLLTLATGISYMRGYSYWEGFYAYFGIPITMLEINKEQFLLYGSPYLLYLLLYSGLLLLLYWIITLPDDDPNNKSSRWLKKVLGKLRLLNLWTFLLAALLIFISLFFGHSILKPVHEDGKKIGSKYALCDAPLTEVVYKDETAKAKKKQLGLLTISKGAYFFFELVHKAEETPNVIILQKESLVSITTIGKVKTETKIEDCKPPQTTNKTKPCC